MTPIQLYTACMWHNLNGFMHLLKRCNFVGKLLKKKPTFFLLKFTKL